MFISENWLQNKAKNNYLLQKSKRIYESFRLANKSIFLSHSHNDDHSLIIGLKNAFAKYGTSLYIDWLDSSTPRITNRLTAEKIKQKIYILDYFWVMATENTLKSK